MTIILALLMITSVLGLFQVFNVGDFGLPPVEVSLLLVFVYAFYHAVWLGRPLRIPRRVEIVVLGVLLLVFAASSIVPLLSGNTPQIAQGIKTLLHFLFMWLAALLLISLPITANQWVKAFRVHFAVSFVVVVFAMYQLPARTYEWPLGWIDITNQTFRKMDRESSEMGQIALRFADFYRATSLFTEPSALAGYASMSLMMMLVPFFRGSLTIIKSKVFLILSIVCTTIALFLAFSVLGLALVCSLLAVCVLLYPRTALKRLGLFLAASVVVLFIADFAIEKNFNISVLTLFSTRVSNLVSGKATGDGSDIIGESVTQRTSDYWVSGKVFETSPIIGVGAGNFGRSEVGKRHFTTYPSTVYGSVLAEMGILGIVVVVFLLLLLFVRALQTERTWAVQHRGEDTDLDRLIPLAPFRMLLIIITGFSGSFLISAIFWFDVVIVMSTVSLARRAMGTERLQELFLVKHSWRQRFIDNRQVLDNTQVHDNTQGKERIGV